MNKKIIILIGLLCIVYIFIFFIPDRVDKLALDPEKVNEGGYYRFFTYPFTHLNGKHLIENIIGAILIAIIATELKIEFSYFIAIYLAAGFLAVLPVWVVWQFIALGASTAVFGGFGLVSKETPKYNMNIVFVILIILAFTFISSIFRFLSGGVDNQFIQSFKQDVSHFAGFLFGIAAYSGALKMNYAFTKHKRRLLRRMDA